MDFVYRVMKNADFTEGRGPMIYVCTFATFEAANAYIMDKKNPWTGKPLKMKCIVEDMHWGYEGYYEIHRDPVIPEYSKHQIDADRIALKELEKQVRVLRARTSL